MKIDEIIQAVEDLDEDGIAHLIDKSKPLQSARDKHTAQGIRSYQGNHPPAPENPPENEIEKARAKVAQKEELFDLAVEKGLDPKSTIALFADGLSNAERLDILSTYGESVAEKTKDRILQDYGREVTERPRLDLREPTYEELNRMSDEQLRRLPPETMTRAVEREIASSKEKKTLRSVLFDRIGGAE